MWTFFPELRTPISRPRLGLTLRGALLLGILACDAAGQLNHSGPDHRTYFPEAPRHSSSSDSVVRVHRVCFPPNPPPVGLEVVLPSGQRAAASDAPNILRQYVGEPFYAPLSSWLSAGQLIVEAHEMIVEYVKLREMFLQELREHIYGIRDADTEARLRMNEDFARAQTPKLVELEARADEIRRELYRTRIFGEYEFDWNAKREWKLGAGPLKRPREQNAVLEYQVLRAAVSFQDGLVPAQRRLLMEVVMDMEDETFRPDSQPMEELGFVFFSPETARVLVPPDLPEGAAVRLEGLTRLKDALKTELRDAIYAVDSHLFRFTRRRDLEELAQNQAGRLGELDAMAEDVRRELIASNAFPRPAAPEPIPEKAEKMFEAFQQDRAELQVKLSQKVAQAHAAVERPVSREPADMADYRDRLNTVAEEARRAFEEENAAAIAALQTDMGAIVGVFDDLIPEDDESLLAGTADAVVESFIARRRAEEAAFEYHAAVFEPGLSPEQRRLLFAGAIRRMGLPLPGSEPQPTQLPGTLLPVGEVGR